MKKLLLLTFVIGLFYNCDREDDPIDPYYQQEMRNFVIGLSSYARNTNSNFIIIPQNGLQLVTSDGEEDGPVNLPYLNAIDGHGQEDLFFGYDDDNKKTPGVETEYLRAFLDKSKKQGNTILITDYCWTPEKMDESYNLNNTNGYVSFAADERELNTIPDYPSTIYNENSKNINSLSAVNNFLYLINPENFSSKSEFINAVNSTNYDLIIMDLFFSDDSEFSATEIDALKQKANGGKRLVIAYMSIGEAEDYRYYWKDEWYNSKPSWMDGENPDWEGNYKVKYWNPEWQNIIYGNNESYLNKITLAHFDGVYLDIIDAFEYYE